MPLRLATFNVENLFSRPEVMNRDSWTEGRPVLDDIALLNERLSADVYTPAIKRDIADLLEKHGFGNRNQRRRPFKVQEVRGKLYKVPRGTQSVEVVAAGRADWVGWVELTREELPGDQIENTGRVINAVNADVLCAIEVEDRLALDRFNRQVLGEVFDTAYSCDLLIDGNDPRGIDIGLLSRYSIASVRTHIHDGDADGSRVFSRDCPEFEVLLPDGASLWVLGNHFKSKGYGDAAANDERRRRQASAVAALYAKARERSPYVAVVGDLNDYPDSVPLSPLLDETDLRDVMAHPGYTGAPGTYDTGTREEQKIDYVLLSPDLWDRVQAVGVERRGIWAPRTFESFPEVTSDRNSASDHAAVWVDLDLPR